MTVTLRVVDSTNFATTIGTLTSAHRVSWSQEMLGDGTGAFTIPHDASELVADPDLIEAGNVIVVNVNSTDVFAWVIQRRQRTRGVAGTDEIVVSGAGAVQLLDGGRVYPRGGLRFASDNRVFGWTALDYQLTDWGTPESHGPYYDPSTPELRGDPGVSPQNEIQRIWLNASGPGRTGQWTVTFKGDTVAVNWDATAAQLKTALELMPTIDEVTITGDGNYAPGSPFVIEFTGAAVAGTKQPFIRFDASGINARPRLNSAGSGDNVRSVYRAGWGVRGYAGIDAVELVPGWPDYLSHWFGSLGNIRFYRFAFTNTTPGKAILHVVGIDPVHVWVDGNQAGTVGAGDIWSSDWELEAREHIIAIKAEGVFMCTVTADTGDPDQPGAVLYRTDPTDVRWVEYQGALTETNPDSPPGVTPGFIVGELMDEAQARDALEGLTRDFDADEDSNGDAWPERVELGLSVGQDSVGSTAARLIDIGVQYRVTPTGVLQMWGGLRADLTGSVTVPVDGVSGLVAETDDETATSMIVRSDNAWFDVFNPTADVRREAFLSLGLVPDVTSAANIAVKVLESYQVPRIVVTCVRSASQTTPVPGSDFSEGSLINGPSLVPQTLAGAWGIAHVVVHTISGSVSAQGDADYILELGTP